MQRTIACDRVWHNCNPFFWASFKLHQLHCVLMRSPSIFVWCDPWFVQIVLNFFHTLIVVHCSVKHGLPVPFETSSSWDQSTSDCWMYFTYIPDVVDVLGEDIWQQYIVLLCRTKEITSWCPWIALKYRKCLEELGFKQYWNLFFGPPPFAKKVIQAWIDHCEVPSNFALNPSTRSSNRTAPSSSWGIVESCRSNLIRDFDTVKQSWQNLSGLISIQFLARKGIDMGDSVTASFSCWAQSYRETCCEKRFQEKWFLTILQQIPFLLRRGVATLYNCCVVLFASSQYLSPHFFAWPSMS